VNERSASGPPPAQALSLPGPAGALEALLDAPRKGAAAPAFGVVCHPHPLHGGTFHNKVVHTLARALNELGIPALRFNFRGVGASAGSYDEGRGETEDALAVVQYGRTRFPRAAPWLLGFSFGAVVAIRAAVRADAARLITVAPAVDRVALDGALPRCPWLLIQGDADDVVPAAGVLAWAARLESPPVVRVLPAVGHFFHGRLPELRAAVVTFAGGTAGN